LGYAQFPELLSTKPATDGVVVNYISFGRGTAFNLSSRFNLGRTATHEVGHWLGLLHIWGDDSNNSNKCSGSDLVANTPNQAIETVGNPAFPVTDICTPNYPGIMFM